MRNSGVCVIVHLHLRGYTGKKVNSRYRVIAIVSSQISWVSSKQIIKFDYLNFAFICIL